MSKFEIEHHSIAPGLGVKIIKSSEFDRLLVANELLGKAYERSLEIDQTAQEHYLSEKARGYQDGLDQASAQVSQQLLQLTNDYADSLNSLQESLVSILPSLVRKVVGVFDEDELIMRLVKNTLTNLSVDKRLRVSVEPSLVAAIDSRKDEIFHDNPMLEFVEVVADPDLQERMCEVSSETLCVTLDLDKQLELMSGVVQDLFGLSSGADSVGGVDDHVVEE